MIARCALVGCLVVLLVPSSGRAQNSMKKIRPAPSELAAKAGSAVAWREDLEAAIAESVETKKPVFWYVPSLERSPMDRKAEIDRYMMAGPFSWPSTVALLNDRFVPVRHVASVSDQKRFGLRRLEFIEPGYVVLDPAGEELGRLDKITTMEARWFERPLRRFGARAPGPWGPDRTYDMPAVDEAAWLAFRVGVDLFRRGQHGEARRQWQKVVKDHPDSSIAWKAAAELEGHGPLARGFEVDEVPEVVVEAETDGSRAPPGSYSAAELWDRGTGFLLRMRDDFGGIVDSTYDFGGTDSLPNVYVACTAIAGWAVLEHGLAHDQEILDEVRRFFDYVADEAHLSADDTDEVVWAQLFRIRLYCRMLDRWPDDERVQAALASAVRALHELQNDAGAWFHEYANPFVTASVLVSMRHAEQHGATVDAAVVERGLKALLSTRSDNGAFSYGMRRGRGNVPSAIGRMALGELALSTWDHGDQERLVAALDASFEHHANLEQVRKYDDHANRYGHGGFFFWYGMRARSEAIGYVADPEKRAA
ncbi:MAG: hypothetical protein KDB80_15210, partial [Planctomycetes bacterium]|nr:hypothetical protein [Planctomycetota bacterium]